MSIYKSSSLAMIPTAVKDGKLYSIRPTDGDGDFTFSRGSNLAATRISASQLIEKGRENLLLQSNTFDTTWTLSNAAVTGGHSGYDGSNDAWELDKTGLYGQVNSNPSTSGVQTYSVYAKAGSLSFLMLRYRTTSTQYHGTYFDLVNGSVETETSQIIDSQIESVGNGWHRCSITFNQSLNLVYVYAADSDGGISNGTTGNIYIQDSQLESSLVPTDVIETGAATAQAGILEDLPRLDYSGGASCPALLLEPQRSNLITQSEYFGDWIETRTTADANQLVSPDGNLNAYKLSETSDSGLHAISINTPVVNGTTYNVSVFAKKGSSDFIQILFGTNNVSGNPYANFDLNEGTFQNNGISSVKIENYGNGWYRCSGTIVISGGTTLTYYLAKVNSLSATRASGFAGNVNNNVYLYGATLEAGSYPTSYIPTMGSAVTRSNDIADGATIDTTASHTFLYDFNSTTGRESSSGLVNIGYDTANRYFIKGTSASSVEFQVAGIGVFGGSISCTNEVSGRNKIAVQWIDGTGYVYSNGVKQSGTLTNTSSANNINYYKAEGRGYSQEVNQLVIFNTALTDSECIALTTI